MSDAAVTCPSAIVRATLTLLQKSGARHQEGIVLWLGRRAEGRVDVVDAYEPAHIAEADFFRIPPPSMQALKEYLRTTRLIVAAQVHSHPMEAFHSKADDRWAIVRHVGAVSIVLPYFAQRTTPERFLSDAAVFQLSGDNRWLQVSRHNLVESVCRISP